MTDAAVRGRARPLRHISGPRRAFAAEVLAKSALAAKLRVQSIARHPAPPWKGGERLRVLVLSPYPQDHIGTQARFGGWITTLRERGVDIEIDCPGPSDAAGSGRGARAFERARRAHLVVVHRGLFPFGPWQRPTFESLLARINPRLVYDFYDALWLQPRPMANANPLVRWLNPVDQVESLCSLAAAVTVSGPFLAEFARRHNEDVRVVPMLVDPAGYRVKVHGRADPVVLGWMGNAGNVPRLLSLAPVLERVAALHPIQVRVVAPCRVDIPGVPVASLQHPWSRESESNDLQAIDIGLLPLTGGPIERGKFPFKALQYAAAGVPFVASAVETDSELVNAGSGCALLARDDDDWVESLAGLIRSPEMRTKMGAAGRALVETRYSFASRADEFTALLEDVARREENPVHGAGSQRMSTP